MGIAPSESLATRGISTSLPISNRVIDRIDPSSDLLKRNCRRFLLARRADKLGIRLASDQSPDLISADLDRFDLIELDFPALGDGRAFSYARLLRERYNYEGEIRAVGDIIKDHLFFMQRCGINSFELPDARDAEDALKALKSFGVAYQPAADDLSPAYRQRSK